ncbi:MAG: GTP pyrophosphokinase [Clostridia bacterium]|nr:GTP pyrophosphokinase [Clostridia bacterium]
MLYTQLTTKALRIAFDAHKEQVDKTGMPYIFHPFHLAEQMQDEVSVCVALLHDVMEDTDITLDDLAAEGFPHEVIEALTYLTHDPAIPYMDYIRALAKNPIARRVKLADLAHNSNLSRLDTVTESDLARNEKYKKATELLMNPAPASIL